MLERRVLESAVRTLDDELGGNSEDTGEGCEGDDDANHVCVEFLWSDDGYSVLSCGPSCIVCGLLGRHGDLMRETW